MMNDSLASDRNSKGRQELVLCTVLSTAAQRPGSPSWSHRELFCANDGQYLLPRFQSHYEDVGVSTGWVLGRRTSLPSESIPFQTPDWRCRATTRHSSCSDVRIPRSLGTATWRNAAVSDIGSTAERGPYVANIGAVTSLVSTLSIVLGSLLGQYLGWSSCSWPSL